MGQNECSLSRLPRGWGGSHHFFLRPQASTDLLLKYGTMHGKDGVRAASRNSEEFLCDTHSESTRLKLPALGALSQLRAFDLRLHRVLACLRMMLIARCLCVLCTGK